MERIYERAGVLALALLFSGQAYADDFPKQSNGSSGDA